MARQEAKLGITVLLQFKTNGGEKVQVVTRNIVTLGVLQTSSAQHSVDVEYLKMVEIRVCLEFKGRLSCDNLK